MFNMDQCNMIEQCLIIMYSSNSKPNEKKSEDIAKANAYLTSLISLANYDLFKYLMINSSNPNAKYYSTNSLRRLITTNYLSIPSNEFESLILSLYELVFTHNQDLYEKCPYLLNVLIALLCRSIRLTWISQYIMKTKELLFDLILKAKKGNLYHLLIAFKICSELLIEYKNKDIPPIDKVLRIIIQFKQACLQMIIDFCFESIASLLSVSIEKNTLSQMLASIREITTCLSECIEFIIDSSNQSSNILNKRELKPILISDTNSFNNDDKWNEKISSVNISITSAISEKLFFIYIQLTNDTTTRDMNYINQILILLEKVLYFTSDYNIKEKEAILSIYQLNIFQILNRDQSSFSYVFIGKLLYSLALHFPQESVSSCNNIFTSISILLKFILNNISTELNSLVNILLFFSSFTEEHLIQNQSYINYCMNILKEILCSISLLTQYMENDSKTLDDFVDSFAKCGPIVFNELMMHLSELLDKSDSNNQKALIIRIITKILKYSYSTALKYDITAFIIAQVYFITFNQINYNTVGEYYLNSIILFVKMLIKTFISKSSSKEIIFAFLTKYNKSNYIPSDIIINIISLLISMMNSKIHQDNHLIYVQKTFKSIINSIRIQYDSINNTEVYYNGCIEISKVPFTQIVFKGIEFIINGNIISKDSKLILSIQVILFKLLLFINDHKTIINSLFASINHQSFQSTNPNLYSLLNTITALIKSIAISSDYQIIIDKIRYYFDSLYDLYSSNSIPLTIKNKILLLFKALTSSKQNIIIFSERQIEVPHLICKSVLCLITKFSGIPFDDNNSLSSVDKYNARIYPISTLIKISNNILIDSKSQLFKSAISEVSFIPTLHNAIFNLYFIISKEEVNSYLYKFKSIYQFANIMYCNTELSHYNTLNYIHLDKVILLITEGIDSLFNIILITCHQIIFQLGKKCIEEKKKDLFMRYSGIFVNVLKNLLCIISQGEITSIHNVASTILVLSIIYENEYSEIIQELSSSITNSNANQRFLNLFIGIERNLRGYNINNFKEKLKQFAQNKIVN